MTEAALIKPKLNNEEQAQVAEMLAGVEEHLGFIPDGLKLYSVSPPLLQSFLGTIGYFLAHATIRQELLATIRYLVASESKCDFCIGLNEGFLTNMGVDMDAVRAARENPDKAPLEEKEKALLKHVLITVNAPTSQTSKDLETLNALGWTDREIFEAILVGSNNRSFSTMLKAFHVEGQGAFA